MQNNSWYEDVVEVVDCATKHFGEKYKLNAEKMKTVESVCDILGRLAIKFDGTCINIDVDEADRVLVLSLECDEIVIENRQACIEWVEFFDLIKIVDSFRFKKAGKGMLRSEFIIGSLWENA